MDTYEFEIWVATNEDLKNGVVCAEIRKYVVAEPSFDMAYRTAMAMAWRGDNMVTKVWWVA